MRKLENNIELIAPGNGCNAMGGAISLDGVECLHAAFQITGAINESTIHALSNTVRALARTRGLWANT